MRTNGLERSFYHRGNGGMKPVTREEATAILTAYHDRMEAAEREGPQAVLEAFRSSPEGVGIHEIDDHMVVVRVNPEELRVLGYREDEMVGHPVFEFVVMQEASQRSVEQKLKGLKDLKPFVRSLKRKDGSALPVLIVERYRKDRQGKIVGIRTMIRAIAAE
jgi:PAS domain S-box-containing protein